MPIEPGTEPTTGAGQTEASTTSPAETRRASFEARRAAALKATREGLGLDAGAAAAEPAPATGDQAAQVAESPEPQDAADEPASDSPETPSAVDDPQLAARLEKIQQAEARSKAKLAKEREELQQARAEHEESQQALRDFEELKRRVNYDPVRVLEALGVAGDDFERIAKALYLHSQGPAVDPTLRDQALLDMRQREHVDALSQTRRELEELRAEIRSREQAETQRRAVESFLGEAQKAITDKTPLMKRMAQRNPQRVQDLIAQQAAAMIEETGEVPDHADVVARLERWRAEDLAETSDDPSAIVPAKSNPAMTGEQPSVTISSADTRRHTSPREAPRNRAELVEQVRSRLIAGDVGE